jgi:hypothetical protein
MPNYKLIGHNYQTPDIVAKVMGPRCVFRLGRNLGFSGGKGNRLNRTFDRAVGIELVRQSLSLAESTALTPLHPSNSPLKAPILDTSWPRFRSWIILSTKSTEIRW